jgi:nitrite reductase/ring-hydroxylating ferredoxin subunit
MKAPSAPEPTESIGRFRVGSVDELRSRGYLTGKVGAQPVCVFWSGGEAHAVEDRCPHLGFPLHRGTVEQGLLTCHWHHARFDLVSGGTLDPFADDVPAFPVELDGDDVVVIIESGDDPAIHHQRRLEEGLEQGLTLVMAKAVLGLSGAVGESRAADTALATGLEFGLRHRDQGWGAGLTVLTAMANVLPVLDPTDRPLALVHGLAFVSRDTRGQSPHFPVEPLDADLPIERLQSWYRRFVDTRSGDAAERTLTTAAASGASAALARMTGSAATDHVFVDGGHTIDFTNKAFEALDHLGWDRAAFVLPSLAHQTAAASRSEESGSWRHPDDLAGLLTRAAAVLPDRLARSTNQPGLFGGDQDVDALAHAVLGEDPAAIVGALDDALDRGATPEELARAVAYAAALRIVRFHVQNDHGDWDVVHHAFTSANAVHQLVGRAPVAELLRGVYQGALRVYLDRFLNVPPARHPAQIPVPAGDPGTELEVCWERQGMVDEAGALVYRWALHRSGSPATSSTGIAVATAPGEPAGARGDGPVLAALGSALLAEDAEFHWFQTYEAAVRQSRAWAPGSEQAAVILAGAARFLAAHTPTRRELPQVVRIAARLGRGDPLYDLADDTTEEARQTSAATS